MTLIHTSQTGYYGFSLYSKAITTTDYLLTQLNIYTTKKKEFLQKFMTTNDSYLP